MTGSPKWLDDLIEATLLWAADVSSYRPALPNAPRLSPYGPTYRTEPLPGAELGGQPRNPEDDVIDEIDHLVDWQLKNGGGW